MIKYYSPFNEDFSNNGDIVLLPSECSIEAILNGDWTLSMTHPIDLDGRWAYIEENGILRVPSFNGEQAFRIKDVVKESGDVSVTAEPIFLDSMNDCFLVDVRPTNRNGQDALNMMLTNSKYSASSDILTLSTAYYECKNFIEALNGTEDNAFINRWGGEIIYDNYTVIVNTQAGSDNNVEILYGKNIQENGITEEVDMRNVITRIVPKAYNGYMLEGSEPWVDSPIIDNYPIPYTSVMSFEYVKLEGDASSNDDSDDIICPTLADLRRVLREQCELQFEEGIDKPEVTISVNIIPLANTEEYKAFGSFESISLGDTVHLRHSRLDIESEARCTAITYDCVNKKITSVTIGDYRYDYLTKEGLA